MGEGLDPKNPSKTSLTQEHGTGGGKPKSFTVAAHDIDCLRRLRLTKIWPLLRVTLRHVDDIAL
jgi:hypothetical protein